VDVPSRKAVANDVLLGPVARASEAVGIADDHRCRKTAPHRTASAALEEPASSVQLAHLHGGIDGAKVYEYNQNPETCQVLPEEKRGSHLRLDSPEGDEPCIEIVRRVSIGGRPDAWTAERRERYLLRLGVPQPLSVDVRVWAAAAQSEGDTVAVSVLLRGVAKDGQGIWLPRALHVDDEVELLGYDVADDVMTSSDVDRCGPRNGVVILRRWRGLKPDRPLFVSARGGHLTHSGAHRVWKAAVERAELPTRWVSVRLGTRMPSKCTGARAISVSRRGCSEMPTSRRRPCTPACSTRTCDAGSSR